MAEELRTDSRKLTWPQERIARHLLEHGSPEAQQFLPQLEVARASPWRCKCGCASFNFVIDGLPIGDGGFHPIDSFLFGDDEAPTEIFAWEKNGVLGGVEVVAYGAKSYNQLPMPEMVRFCGAGHRPLNPARPILG